jgi:hypothetical protein
MTAASGGRASAVTRSAKAVSWAVVPPGARTTSAAAGPERRDRRGADAEIGRTADRVGGHGKETRQRPHSNTWPPR